MSALARNSEKNLALPFQWRDRDGGFHDPKDMASRHLFHTISMIWNHIMPVEARTHDYRRYAFQAFYTDDYLRRAVRAMLPELLSRGDLKAEWRKRLDFMRGWLLAQEGIEIVVIQPPLRTIGHGGAA